MKTLSTAAQAASMIRKHLKANGIACTVKSENYAGGNSVNVWIADPLPATRAQIELYLAQFEYGSFDGMTDSYNYDNRRDDIPQVRFVFLNSEYSDEMRQACWEWLVSYYGFENAPAGYRAAGSYQTSQGMYSYGDMLIANELATGWRGFWFTQKKRLAA